MNKNEPAYKDSETLERMYWYEGKSQSEIAEELGCSATTISKYMNKFNIKTRDPSIYINGGENAIREQIEMYINNHKELNDIDEEEIGEKPIDEIVEEIKKNDYELNGEEKSEKPDRPEIITEYEGESESE